MRYFIQFALLLLLFQISFAESIEANSVHGSDSPETAALEISYFFNELDIVG